MPRDVVVDVVVIGGGPAGCAVALNLRKRGLVVAVVAASTPQVRMTETAAPKLRVLLDGIGAGEALRACEPCFGIVSNWGRTESILRSSLLDPFGHAWFVHRAAFDAALVARARASGVEWISETVRRVHLAAGKISVPTHEKILRAKYVVFASGAPTWVSRVTGVGLESFSRQTASWAELDAALPERVLTIEAQDDGWWYAAPDHGSRVQVCFVGDDVLRAGWNERFARTALFERLGGARAKAIRVRPVEVAALDRAVGERWVAIGDAAAKLDPIGSSGLVTAIDGAARAANAITAAIDGDREPLDAVGEYFRGLVSRFVRERAAHYALEPRIKMARGRRARRGDSFAGA